MSEVKHYFWVQDGMSEGGKSLETYVKSPDHDRVTAERDAVLGREAALLEELAKRPSEIAMSLQAKLDALQQRLTAADERADALNTALSRIQFRCQSFVENDCAMAVESVEAVLGIADAALKPAEVGGDETI